MTIYPAAFVISVSNGSFVRANATINGKSIGLKLYRSEKYKCGYYASVTLVENQSINVISDFTEKLSTDSSKYDLRFSKTKNGFAFKLRIKGTTGEPRYFIKER